ncbi:unnamed protein product [Pocillopora meandrina]|uniref:Uncharacterized protein n=1 Tax=Pocillopora meandrina TaxID=46732 RepID=A0AAU9VLH6_9CNID|nr:unnamed protein product [Pocillopora meandrina]
MRASSVECPPKTHAGSDDLGLSLSLDTSPMEKGMFKNLAYNCHTITSRNLLIASQVHVSTIPFRRRHFRSFLQAEKKGQHRLAESLCQLCRTEADRRQHLAAVLLEFLPKSHPDKQRRGRMEQRAQQTGAGKKSISPVYADPAASRIDPPDHPSNPNDSSDERAGSCKIFSLWDQYENGDRTAKQLLRTCFELYRLRDD